MKLLLAACWLCAAAGSVVHRDGFLDTFIRDETLRFIGLKNGFGASCGLLALRLPQANRPLTTNLG